MPGSLFGSKVLYGQIGMLVCLLSPSVAVASDCPPGWYCEAPPAGEAQRAGEAPLPAEAADEPAIEPRPASPAKASESTSSGIQLPAEPVPPRQRKPWRRLGTQVRVSVAFLGRAQSGQAGAAGLGAAFRYRPSRVLALELGIDAFSGRDFVGEHRDELSVSTSALLSPRTRYRLRPYLLGGLFFASASVSTAARRREYGYFGGIIGLGVEYSLSPSIALGSDLVGFVRTRTDAKRGADQEFVDTRTGRGTNTSGGGLLRLALTHYF